MWCSSALLLASLFAVARPQRAPASPCPQVFQYQINTAGQYIGHVLAPAPQPAVPLEITVKLFVTTFLTDLQNGRVRLRFDKDVISRQINAGNIETVDYEVTFPVQSPLPQIDQIIVNKRIICQGPPVRSRLLTQVTLVHTLYPLILPTSNQNANEDIIEQRHQDDVQQAPPPTTRRPNTRSTTRRRPVTTTRRNVVVTRDFGEQEESCGMPISPTPLILEGQPTAKGDWPWLAAIIQAKDTVFICGSTIINRRHVVTAAHCMRDRNGMNRDKKGLLVVAGKHELFRWGEDKNQINEVLEVHVHPDFDYVKLANDIAVLYLDRAFTYDAFVMPICMWDSDVDLNLVVGQIGTVVGWGRTVESADVVNTPLMARVPIVPQDVCLRSRSEFPAFTTDKSLCAGFKNGTGPCSGDSGGGFVLPREVRGVVRWYLRGIVSFAINDVVNRICNLHEYVVYTDVAKYLDWLKQFRRA